METFVKAREFVEHPGYVRDRQGAIASLELASIDDPIKDIVEGLALLPHCFSLQCCYGHFVCDIEQDSHNLDPIPLGFSGLVTFRIAYLAFCLENSRRGLALRQSLARLPAIDPGYIQFGSAEWFWDRWPNSYALQVEPEAHARMDSVILKPNEARHTQAVRDLFFEELRALLLAESREHGAG